MEPKQGGKKEHVEKLAVEISEELRLGKYSNFVQIQHTPMDFRLDLAQISPEERKYVVVSRIFMSPQHVKLFANALVENINKFEKQFGEIRVGSIEGFTPSSEEVH